MISNVLWLPKLKLLSFIFGDKCKCTFVYKNNKQKICLKTLFFVSVLKAIEGTIWICDKTSRIQNAGPLNTKY
jgi:hypothetical protein